MLGVAAGLRRRPRALIVGARVEDHVLGLRAGALDLQVAAHAGAELLSRDPLAVRERRLRRVADHRAPLHVDQVLVVGAGDLVLVARREVAAGVLLEQAGVAGRVVLRGAARVRLGVAAGHDQDPVVVARVEDRLLDRVVVALLRQRGVDREQPVRLLLGELDLRLARAEAIALLAGLAHRRAQVGQRLRPVLALADDQHLARSGAARRRLQRARRRHLAAGRRGDGGVRGRVGPVGGPLEVGKGERRQGQHHGCDRCGQRHCAPPRTPLPCPLACNRRPPRPSSASPRGPGPGQGATLTEAGPEAEAAGADERHKCSSAMCRRTSHRQQNCEPLRRGCLSRAGARRLGQAAGDAVRPELENPAVAGLSWRADEGTRTPDPLLTMEVLYQLSYVGIFRLAAGSGGSRIRTCVG